MNNQNVSSNPFDLSIEPMNKWPDQQAPKTPEIEPTERCESLYVTKSGDCAACGLIGSAFFPMILPC
jgi:hypothetical protein